jgi:hypothetical protein
VKRARWLLPLLFVGCGQGKPCQGAACPAVAGTYDATLTRQATSTGIDAGADAARACASVAVAAEPGALVMALTQSGSSLSASLNAAGYSAQVQGTLFDDNTATLSGTAGPFTGGSDAGVSGQATDTVALTLRFAPDGGTATGTAQSEVHVTFSGALSASYDCPLSAAVSATRR